MDNQEHLSHDVDHGFEEGISLKELFTTIWNWKWVLIILTGVGLFIGGLAGYFSVKDGAQVTTILEFQWDGISKGEYPDGQRFDYGSTFDANIYAQAIDDADLDLSVSDLQKYVSITPIVPTNVLEIAEKAMLESLDYTYYPTSFRVSVKTGKLGITEEQGIKMLTTLVDTYRADFERKYVQKSVVLDFAAADLETIDYIQAQEILETQVILIQNVLDTVLPEANEFVSTTLNTGFSDVYVRLDVLNSVLLSNMESRINNYLLTKDADLLITIYQYRIEQLERELSKNQSIETELVTLIDTYKGGTSTIIIPGMDQTNEIQTEPYLNTLYQRLVDTQAKIATDEQDIVYYNLRIDRLEGNDPNFILTPEKKASETQIVEDNILYASNMISELVDDTEIMLEEYNLLISRGLVKQLVPPQDDTNVSLLLYAAIGLVLGGMIGVGAIFVIDYQVKMRKENK